MSYGNQGFGQQQGFPPQGQGFGGPQQPPFQQGGYQQGPSQGGYQQGPPQGGYQQGPPQGGYQQGPPQGGYQQGPPQGGYQQGPPQGGYQQGPPQGGYQQGPPQGGHQQGPQGGYQQGPPQGGYQQVPPQGGYQQGGYQQGNPQGGYQHGPPQGGFPPQGYAQQQSGYPPQGQFPTSNQYPPQQGGYGPPALPSPGYDPRAVAIGDATWDAQSLRSAMKGFGTNEAALSRVLVKQDPLQMALLRKTYAEVIGRNLEKDITSETSSHFREGLLQLMRGPLMADVHNIHNALKGVGTREAALNDSLLGRSNADMRAIKQAYQETFHKSLESDVKGDLSMKTERLFGMVLQATRNEESSPIIPAVLDRDCNELHRATEGAVGTDEIQVCSILSQRSDGQIRAIAQMYQQKYHITLAKIIEKEFSGHMQDALLLILGRATDPAMTEAELLEASMKGIGTKDNLLVNRVIRNHWNPAQKDQIKKAYAHRYKRELISRVRGEVSGDYRRLMIEVLT